MFTDHQITVDINEHGGLSARVLGNGRSVYSALADFCAIEACSIPDKETVSSFVTGLDAFMTSVDDINDVALEWCLMRLISKIDPVQRCRTLELSLEKICLIQPKPGGLAIEKLFKALLHLMVRD